MKWIKINDQPPPINKTVCCRGLAPCVEKGKFEYEHYSCDNGVHNPPPALYTLKDVEWLDESESPTTADASVLKEALEKIQAWINGTQNIQFSNLIGKINATSAKAIAQYNTPSPSGANHLVEALEKIGKQMKVSEHDGTAMFPELVREFKERVQIARDALAQYNAQTPRTARFIPGELDTVGEHPSDSEPEGEEWDATEFYSGDLVAYADRILRDKGASNKDVLEGIEQAVNDLKGQYNIVKK